MPSNRFDDDMPRIMIDQEDRETYRQSRTKGQHAKDYGAPDDTASTSSSTTETQSSTAQHAKSSGSPMTTILLFLLVLAGFGGSYFLYMQQQQLTNTLIQAQNRIQDLENQLSATGEEMGESAVVIQAKVSALDAKSKELWRQMDKLWASAWRRNQSDIKVINQQLESFSTGTKTFTSQIKTLTSQIRTLQRDITASLTNIDLLQEQLNTQSDNVKDVALTVTQSSRSLEKVTQGLASASRKLKATDKTNNGLIKRINDLEKWQKQTKFSRPIPKEPVKKDIPPPLTVGE